jgi:hypothetical protein
VAFQEAEIGRWSTRATEGDFRNPCTHRTSGSSTTTPLRDGENAKSDVGPNHTAPIESREDQKRQTRGQDGFDKETFKGLARAAAECPDSSAPQRDGQGTSADSTEV